ncbi:Rrf2 family transcriptional regulator [Lentilactobacillus kosonis]|uniref:Rrf2 family transcriptional regulator, group III n=1 Tax=Lentilactobacillus kosonis TaxID=2810561 RepID=A0A401FNP8_9LACO|nr:Rrf2 family transcriptional regulator [Lentilactobacillus kosonis]GAY73984.1 Rrf2 family transcriptional regulator, group III [Lentilactobacillus kosonis]
MKYSYKLSDAIHILTYLIVYQEGDLSSRAIANSIETNSSAVRGLMVDLKRAGIINTQQGSSEPTLSRPADQITMFDVYQAINMDHDLIHVDPKTNPNCIVGSNIQDTLNEVYQNVEQAAFRSMAETTIQEIIDGVLQRESQK